jgi:hypothetical protein
LYYFIIGLKCGHDQPFEFFIRLTMLLGLRPPSTRWLSAFYCPMVLPQDWLLWSFVLWGPVFRSRLDDLYRRAIQIYTAKFRKKERCWAGLCSLSASSYLASDCRTPDLRSSSADTAVRQAVMALVYYFLARTKNGAC